ncbi:MAG TPA: FAD-dependent oxidoreductase [Polyangiaceae bacterium]|nr:FAD-dependent oxidoreductase [Polyangiaceae bacterium]
MSGAALGGGAHIVIVGASLAGLRAAEGLRAEGFTGRLTIVGDEPYLPYDRPPLSKAVLAGRVPADHTTLPRIRTLADVEWRLGMPATRLDLARYQVSLADGRALEFDRLLIATGTRARPWRDAEQARLDGVFTLRTRDDAERLHQRLSARPGRVLVIGAGFTGSEVASVCRELGLAVTVVERSAAPLIGALGRTIALRVAELQRAHGVDLRCGVQVEALEGDAEGRLRRARLSDGSTVDAEVAVVALGALRNTEWLDDSGLAAGDLGVACDAGCRAIDANFVVTDDLFVAGDVARFPHPLYRQQFLALEHWGNAVQQAGVAAHNMVCAPADRRPHLVVPEFWSSQFGVNIKSVGVPSAADEVMITQGSLEEGRFVAAYGREGQVVAAVSFNQGRWMEFYERLIAQAAAFPLEMKSGEGRPLGPAVPAWFPEPAVVSRQATAILTGHDPNTRRTKWIPRRNVLEGAGVHGRA